MTWRVSFKDAHVVAELENLPEPDRFRASRKIGHLEEDPFPPGSKKLKARYPLYRIRSGDYRIIYALVPEDRLIIITRVGHRKDVYRGL
jgi:mRNA interferase RelE/StbE